MTFFEYCFQMPKNCISVQYFSLPSSRYCRK
ncbi:hypothetical protein [Leptolyngbya sp. FACHB-671]